MSKKQRLGIHLCLFLLGGFIYIVIELLWRRRTHPSMFVVGGLCFELIGCIHTVCRRLSLLTRCGLCAVAVSLVELVSGCVLNLWLKLGVWDYSRMRFHLFGQVCLVYSLLWMGLSALAFPVYSRCRRLFCRALARR